MDNEVEVDGVIPRGIRTKKTWERSWKSLSNLTTKQGVCCEPRNK